MKPLMKLPHRRLVANSLLSFALLVTVGGTALGQTKDVAPAAVPGKVVATTPDRPIQNGTPTAQGRWVPLVDGKCPKGTTEYLGNDGKKCWAGPTD